MNRDLTPLDDAWKRIESWFSRHSSTSGPYPLAPGATQSEIGEFESMIRDRLPEDFHASYARHNGSNGIGIFGILGMGYWRPLFDSPDPSSCILSLATQWQFMAQAVQDGVFADPSFLCEPKGPIKSDKWWNDRWLPFTDYASGDYLCVDLDPPENGTRGQIIFWWHEVGPHMVVAKSFTELLCWFADRLDADVYELGKHGLCCRDQHVVNFDQMLAVLQGEA